MVNLLADTSISIALVIPVVTTLCAVIAVLFYEWRKDRKRYSELEQEFRSEILKLDKNYLDKSVKQEEEFRYELKKVLREAYDNNIKIVQALNSLELTDRDIIHEIQELIKNVNNINMNINKTQIRRKE